MLLSVIENSHYKMLSHFLIKCIFSFEKCKIQSERRYRTWRKRRHEMWVRKRERKTARKMGAKDRAKYGVEDGAKDVKDGLYIVYVFLSRGIRIRKEEHAFLLSYNFSVSNLLLE